MIPKECKRLAEVDFPIAVVSKWAAKEKNIRHGHPSTLHLWWARRPLGACRAMLLALLLPDPGDPNCPKEFKKKARDLLEDVQGRPGNKDEHLRKGLLKFIGDFANWDMAEQERYLSAARSLIQAAHGEEAPLVVDPFAGGGSIPLEALRLGCEAFASDLNPVACLINKIMLESIPRSGPALADELERVGEMVKAAVQQDLAEFYPRDADGAEPIAYLWARTVHCEAPNCGAEIPLTRSFWLSKKKERKRALRFKVEGKGTRRTAVFEIFTPKADREVPGGTVSRARATCPCCQTVLSPERVRAQLREQRGGSDIRFDKKGKRTGGARLMAVVTLKSGEGRQFRLPTEQDYRVVWQAMKQIGSEKGNVVASGMSALPNERIHAEDSRNFWVAQYGAGQFGDLFTARQKLMLLAHRRHISALAGVSPVAREIAGLALSRFTDISNALCQWMSTTTQLAHLFTRQAIPMVWDFAEADPFAAQAGDYTTTLGSIIRVVKALPSAPVIGQVEAADATSHPLNDSGGEVASVWFTDPPYYDAVPYADLSDFFFVWLKRVLPNHPLLRDPYDQSNPLTPKEREAVQNEVSESNGLPKDRAFFERTMASAFTEGRKVLKQEGIGCVVFAHKTTEGWEALLSGMIGGGWTITGSWPIATERTSRLRSRDSAALATSVHLVCRPRPADASIGDWHDVLRKLPIRVAEWMQRLQQEGVRGADLVFACIGPALEIYSRYEKVLDAEDRPIPLGGEDPESSDPHRRGYLAYVWEVVARAALEQVLGSPEAKARNGSSGALEEDARLSALFLWTLQSTSAAMEEDEDPAEEDEDPDDEEESPRGKKKAGFSLPFDVARRFAQPLGIHLDQWEHRIIEIEKGVVRLLPVAERAVQIFGEEGASAIDTSEAHGNRPSPQLRLFPDMTPEAAPPIKAAKGGRKGVTDDKLHAPRGATTLDRVHAAMLLQMLGRTNALRALLKEEKQRGPNFLRLANSLSALYPQKSEEKRLVDAMLLAMPR